MDRHCKEKDIHMVYIVSSYEPEIIGFRLKKSICIKTFGSPLVSFLSPLILCFQWFC